jgi:hypothetical protein
MRILVVVIEVEINTVLLNDKNLTAESQHRVEFRITERDEGFCMPSERHEGLLRGGKRVVSANLMPLSLSSQFVVANLSRKR